MWMSSITCGVKIELWPSTLVLRPSGCLVDGVAAGSFVSFAMDWSFRAANLENELLLGGLEVVVVPELPAGHDLVQVPDALRRLEAVQLQLALEPLHIEVGPFCGQR